MHLHQILSRNSTSFERKKLKNFGWIVYCNYSPEFFLLLIDKRYLIYFHTVGVLRISHEGAIPCVYL